MSLRLKNTYKQYNDFQECKDSSAQRISWRTNLENIESRRPDRIANKFVPVRLDEAFHAPPALEEVRLADLNPVDEKNVVTHTICFHCLKPVGIGPERKVCQGCNVIAHSECANITSLGTITPPFSRPGTREQSRANTRLKESPNSKLASVKDKDTEVHYQSSSLDDHLNEALDQNKDIQVVIENKKDVHHDAPVKVHFEDNVEKGINEKNVKVSNASTVMVSMLSRDLYKYRGNNSSEERPAEIKEDEITVALKNGLWYCTYCIEDVEETNTFYFNKHEKEVERFYTSKTCRRLQSIARTIRERHKYKLLRRGIILLQRAFRMRRLLQASRSRQAVQKWPFRIRINDIALFLKDGKFCPPLSKYVRGLTPENKVGSISHEDYMEAIRNKSDTFNRHTQETSYTISHSHIDGPQYSSHYTELQSFPRDSLFLTICLMEYDETTKVKYLVGQQRIDVPLKTGKNINYIRKNTMKKLGLTPENVIDMDGLTRNYKMIHVSLARPYLMIPYFCPNIEIHYILSQVTDWPRAFVIGKTVSYSVFNDLHNRRVTVFQQGFQFLGRKLQDILPQEDGGKLNTSVKDIATTAQDLPKIKPQPIKSRKKSMFMTEEEKITLAEERKQNEKDVIFSPSHLYQCGMITTTVIPLDDKNSLYHAGFVNIHTQEFIESSKKKTWAVFTDKFVYFYIIDNLKQKANFKASYDVGNSHVSLLADDMIRIKSNVDTVYIGCLNLNDLRSWLPKLYKESSSQNSVSFPNYIKRFPDYGNSFVEFGSPTSSKSGRRGSAASIPALSLSNSPSSPSGKVEDKNSVDATAFRNFRSTEVANRKKLETLERQIDYYLMYEKSQYIYNDKELNDTREIIKEYKDQIENDAKFKVRMTKELESDDED